MRATDSRRGMLASRSAPVLGTRARMSCSTLVNSCPARDFSMRAGGIVTVPICESMAAISNSQEFSLRLDLPHQLERGGLQFVDIHVHHDFLRGIEQTVVVNVEALPHGPLAVGPVIRLHRLSFDFVAQPVLLAVGVRHVVVIERKW